MTEHDLYLRAFDAAVRVIRDDAEQRGDHAVANRCDAVTLDKDPAATVSFMGRLVHAVAANVRGEVT